MKSPDRIRVPGGIVYLPSVLREVAEAANRAGLAGWKIEDLKFGLDREHFQASIDDAGRSEFPIPIHELPEIDARVEITYATEAAS